MIPVTDELIALFEERGTDGDGNIVDTRAGLESVLAAVGRDNDVTPKVPPFEHRAVRGPWWNHYASAYTAECTCGAEFSDGDLRGAKWRLDDHIDDQGGGS